jgi:S-DNA-T family DNA segregation ATPase FtsK/SpoIIIE
MSRSRTGSKANSRATQKSEPTLADEIIGLFLAGLGVIVLLALISYDRQDPSWTTASSRSVQNWIGPFGANVASLLNQALGWVSLLVPVALFALAWWRWREPRFSVSGIKMLGLLLIVLSLTGLLAVLDSGRPESFYLGGWIGYSMIYSSVGLASFLNRIGSGIALLVIFIAGVLMATPLSLVAMIVQLTPHEQEVGLWAAMWERFQLWREHRAELREQRDAENENYISLSDDPATASTKTQSREVRKAALKEDTALTTAAAPAVKPTIAKSEVKPETAVTASAKIPASVPAAKNEEAIMTGGDALNELLPSGTRPSAAREKPAPAAASARAEKGETGFSRGEDHEESVASQRSVEEMLASAKIKRTGGLEEDHPDAGAELTTVKPKSKASTLLKNVLRTKIDYKLPSSEILAQVSMRPEMADTELMDRAHLLAEKCKEFNVAGVVQHIMPGPVVTTFEFKPDPGVKYSRVTSLVDDLCLGLKAESIRIDRIPGKATVGIEVPNDDREIIRLRSVIDSEKFQNSSSKLTLALGKTIDGSNYVADLAKMPHLLIAGATGAGKSVALNSILMSLLYKARPDEVKLILIDPKRLELGLYADIPHLITPIVTDPKRASYSLRWAVAEMENRYKHLATFGVRNIDQYNNEICAMVDRNLAEESDELPAPLPYIVIVIDELADLMMVAARDVEESITRLAQMARAVGIHLILATQRPSVDVITGLIKANFPSRISFRVSSKVDSRTIIDANGAEALLGQGDMLFLPPGTSRLVRVHGAFVDEKEVKRVCDHTRVQGQPIYDEKVQMSEKESEGDDLNGEMRHDEKYEDAVRVVVEMGRASTSVLQRRLGIGYGRAAAIIDMMHREGIVGPENGSKPREVLVKADFIERLDQIREGY